jgi:rod shape-determining protein MreC
MLPRRRTLTLLAVLCLGHVLLISSQVPAASGKSALDAAAFGSVARVQSTVGGFTGGIRGMWSHYIALGSASRENEALRTKVLELEGQLEGERARGARVDSLEDALNLKRSIVSPTLTARVIAGNPIAGVLTVNVDRGTTDGVHSNMAVINGRGVIGRVMSNVSKNAAPVQLLIDQRATAGALLEKSGSAGGVTGGFADGNLRLGMISSATPVAMGERVLTSGQDGIYPQGFLIGQVVQINGTGKAREVVVAPAVNFERIDVVLIVLAQPQPAPEKPKK